MFLHDCKRKRRMFGNVCARRFRFKSLMNVRLKSRSMSAGQSMYGSVNLRFLLKSRLMSDGKVMRGDISPLLTSDNDVSVAECGAVMSRMIAS